MRPTRRLLALLGAWTALGLGASVVPAALWAWLGFAAVLAVLFVVELLGLRRRSSPSLERRAPATLSVGEWHDVRLRLESDLHSAQLTLFDGVPGSFEVEGLPAESRVPGGGWAELVYRVRPTDRGAFEIAPATALLDGPLGLLRARRSLGEPAQVRVYPNFRQVARFALLAMDNRVSQMGVHLRRRRGEGTEFHQLREYRQGDALRQIDWKAVSRRHQLISREYREEQDQQVLFAVDCGRRLRGRDGSMAHFDHVLNAVLLLTWVAVRQGDAVGMLTFSGSDRWVKPIKGRTAMNTLLDNVFDLQTSTAPSDFAEAARRVSTRQRRRALVIVLTDLRDDDSTELPAAMATLRRRHLVLVASLRDPALGAARDLPVTRFDDAVRFGAAHHYLEQRRRAHELVAGRGLHLLDTEPADLPVALVNRYLAIKRAGLL